MKLLKSGGNVTLVVDNLEKRGLVRRRRAGAPAPPVPQARTAHRSNKDSQPEGGL